jgi:hypothetical protein
LVQAAGRQRLIPEGRRQKAEVSYQKSAFRNLGLQIPDSQFAMWLPSAFCLQTSDFRLQKMATYLVTGCARSIGGKVTEFLLADGHTVVGVDNLNDAYDVRLKQWRLAQLKGKSGFTFHRLDITDRAALGTLFKR